MIVYDFIERFWIISGTIYFMTDKININPLFIKSYKWFTPLSPWDNVWKITPLCFLLFSLLSIKLIISAFVLKKVVLLEMNKQNACNVNVNLINGLLLLLLEEMLINDMRQFCNSIFIELGKTNESTFDGSRLQIMEYNWNVDCNQGNNTHYNHNYPWWYQIWCF